MSLFGTREYWSVRLNGTEIFSSESLLIANINGRKSIFIGSHDGYLRCYCQNDSNGYNPSDLMLETLFDSPVLHLKFAALVSGSREKQLAVLHPRSVAVYHVQHTDATQEGTGAALLLRHAYQHQLHRSAHSFVTGAFGNVKGREFLCVLSMDGQLSIFEQEAQAIEVQLPNILLPGPFRYMPSVDCFLIQDANLYLVCYSYENLSEGKLISSWVHDIGEYVLDMKCLEVPQVGLNIVLLTERNLYNINDNGGIVFMKRFEFRPMCFHCYVNSQTYKIISLVCTEFQTLNIYEETCLKWSVKLEFVPIQINTTDVHDIQGLVVLLSDSGQLACVYLGTIPSLYIIPPTTEEEINVLDAENELKRLQAEIANSEFVGNVADDILNIKFNVDEKVNFAGDRNICKISLDLIPQIPINKVQVLFNVEYPLICTVNATVISSVCKKETIEAGIFVGPNGSLSNLDITAIVSYISSNGVPRVIQQTSQVPFEIGVIFCSPSKDAAVKFTINANKPTCPLNELFPGSDASANAIGFGHLNSGNTVSIVAAKASQRYRIQAENLEDSTLVMDSLVTRLRKHFKRSSDFVLTYTGALPLQTYFENIEKHYELITRRRLKQEQLSQRCAQYRIIQKKILVTLKDLTPKPSSALHKVLDDTFNMMKATIDELDKMEKNLQESRCRIAAISRLIVLLLKLMTLKATDLENLMLAFNPRVLDNDEQGWLEVQNATLMLLLRSVFAKSSKDQNKPMEMTLEPLTDVSKLCKNFATIIDRVTKGTNLLERAEFAGEKSVIPTIPSVKNWEEKQDVVVPAGSKMVDFTAHLPPIVHLPKLDDNPRRRTLIVDSEEMSILVPVQAEVTIETNHEAVAENVPQAEESRKTTERQEIKAQPRTSENDKRKSGKDQTKYEMEPHRKASGIEDDDMWDLDFEEMRI